MALYTKINNAWRQVTATFTNVAGVWQLAKEAYIKQDGSWQLVYDSYPQLTISTIDAIERTGFSSVSVDIAANPEGGSGQHTYRWFFVSSGDALILANANTDKVKVTSSTWGVRGGVLVCEVTDLITGSTATSNPCTVQLRVRELGGNN